jgi:hypothetical protein
MQGGTRNDPETMQWKGVWDCFALLCRARNDRESNLICGRFIRIATSRKAGLAMTVKVI